MLFGLVLLAVAWFVYAKFDAKGQWAAEKWKPLVQGDVWTNIVIPGLEGTLKAAATAGVLALVLGRPAGPRPAVRPLVDPGARRHDRRAVPGRSRC